MLDVRREFVSDQRATCEQFQLAQGRLKKQTKQQQLRSGTESTRWSANKEMG